MPKPQIIGMLCVMYVWDKRHVIIIIIRKVNRITCEIIGFVNVCFVFRCGFLFFLIGSRFICFCLSDSVHIVCEN